MADCSFCATASRSALEARSFAGSMDGSGASLIRVILAKRSERLSGGDQPRPRCAARLALLGKDRQLVRDRRDRGGKAGRAGVGALIEPNLPGQTVTAGH